MKSDLPDFSSLSYSELIQEVLRSFDRTHALVVEGLGTAKKPDTSLQSQESSQRELNAKQS
jgi:hypothetical protein